MSETVIIPDIGTTAEVDVIEVLVAVGDTVAEDDSLITLEGEKATMEIPAPAAGVVEAVNVAVGDKVKQGDAVVTLATTDAAPVTEPPAKAETPAQAETPEPTVEVNAAPAQDVTPSAKLKPLIVPDLGNATDVDIIEVHVAAGEFVEAEAALITLEGDKATMDIPAAYSGEIKKFNAKVGDKISAGDVLGEMLITGATPTKSTEKPVAAAAATPEKKPTQATPAPVKIAAATKTIYASPSIRRFARELGVDLTQIQGSAHKGRIIQEDVQQFVKKQLAGGSAQTGLGIEPMPVIDFSQFGSIEVKALNKIKKLTAKNMHRSWVTVPHVTQFDEADITEMDAFRKENKKKAEAQGFKLTPLVFLMKAVAHGLRELPQFNSSLSPDGESLIYKHYFNIGVAVDTPKGLVVPVVRDVDKKSIYELAKELGDISLKAREKGLNMKEMQGSCMTISSLGGIGGTAFTPIVNAPDVAILGVSKAQIKPVYREGAFVPRLLLPLSLSYDHRVIDGADAARFTSHLCAVLADLRQLLL